MLIEAYSFFYPFHRSIVHFSSVIQPSSIAITANYLKKTIAVTHNAFEGYIESKKRPEVYGRKETTARRHHGSRLGSFSWFHQKASHASDRFSNEQHSSFLIQSSSLPSNFDIFRHVFRSLRRRSVLFVVEQIFFVLLLICKMSPNAANSVVRDVVSFVKFRHVSRFFSLLWLTKFSTSFSSSSSLSSSSLSLLSLSSFTSFISSSSSSSLPASSSSSSSSFAIVAPSLVPLLCFISIYINWSREFIASKSVISSHPYLNSIEIVNRKIEFAKPSVSQISSLSTILNESNRSFPTSITSSLIAIPVLAAAIGLQSNKHHIAPWLHPQPFFSLLEDYLLVLQSTLLSSNFLIKSLTGA